MWRHTGFEREAFIFGSCCWFRFHLPVRRHSHVRLNSYIPPILLLAGSIFMTVCLAVQVLTMLLEPTQFFFSSSAGESHALQPRCLPKTMPSRHPHATHHCNTEDSACSLPSATTPDLC